MRPVGGGARSTSAETGSPSASAMAASVAIVGDLVLRSRSEIIEAETPLLAARARNVSPSCSRLVLIAWATCAVSLSAIVDTLASIVYNCSLSWTQTAFAVDSVRPLAGGRSDDGGRVSRPPHARR